jgi:DNA-binding response OmpR family regulator
MSAQKEILIVDDEWMLVETISYHLQKAGYKTATAMDGEAGLRRALEIQPSLLILDVMLPHLSGWDVCRALRGSPQFGSQIPILMMSARGQTEDRADSLAAGANDFLSKPFGMQELLTKVQLLLSDS